MAETSGENEEISPLTYACPSCGQLVEVEKPRGWITCPHCGEQFVASASEAADSDEEPESADSLSENEARRREGELDSLHIRNVSVARRAAIRSRSYALIAAIACAVVVGQLVIMTITHLRYHLEGYIKPIGYVLCAIAGVWGMIFFYQRAAEFKREIDHSAIGEPTTPPDFSTLSDGSQHVRNLEEMR